MVNISNSIDIKALMKIYGRHHQSGMKIAQLYKPAKLLKTQKSGHRLIAY